MSHRHQRRNILLLIALTIAMAIMLVTSGTPAYSNPSTLRVSFIDVGYGDSILLSASDGTDILIDGGGPSAGPTVVAYLQAQGVDDIDILVATHAHSDHISGLIDVLESSIPVEAVIEGVPGTTDLYDDFLTATQNKGVTPTQVIAGQSFTWGALQAAVLNPQSPPRYSPNEDSVVLLITYGNNRFLFAGDSGLPAEGDILASGADIDAGVLKVGHHGSHTSTGPLFLDAVTPIYAVISVGVNWSGYPSPEVLDRLVLAGAEIYRTDIEGTVVITSDGAALTTNQQVINHAVFLPLVQHEGDPLD
ncbi:MAG: MBL fold metallo-hydrolase [Anaerolineales bacterium]|nr:MAG: MBL fold metallo-hydrolase [Anaerolineales bacterium]